MTLNSLRQIYFFPFVLGISLFVIFKVTGFPSKYEANQKKKRDEFKEGKSSQDDKKKIGKEE